MIDLLIKAGARFRGAPGNLDGVVTFYVKDPIHVANIIKKWADVQQLSAGTESSIKIEVVYMTREEFSALPKM